jgi:hypothetical protein
MISILLPSTGREERLARLLDIIEPSLPVGGEIIVVLDHDDIVERMKYEAVGRMVMNFRRTQFVVTQERGCWCCTNIAMEHARNETILWTADDVKPHEGWLEKGLACFHRHFPDGLGLVALNDLHCMDQTAGHAITSRQFLWVLFGQRFLPDGFRHFFLDTMISDWAKNINRHHFCEEAILEHMHWRVGKAERDATNERNETTGAEDKALKDKMDEYWLHGGGIQEALRRSNRNSEI